VGPAGGNPRLAGLAVAAAAQGFAAGGTRVARNPDHRGQRLVLVVQPQARLGHGPDLGQPVPPAPAQCLQADGAAGPGAPVSADPPEGTDARARAATGRDSPGFARRPGVVECRLLPG